MATETQQATMNGDDAEKIAIDEDGEVTLPVVEVLTGRAFLTGKSGAGKSNSASVVAESFSGTGVDIRHEVRSDDADGVPDDWTPAEVYEAREHGVDKITRADGKEWWS